MKQPTIRTKNPHELRVLEQLKAEGYTVLRRGWPDFLAFKAGEVRLVEVKKPTCRVGLKPDQERMAQVLARAGLKVEVAYGELLPGFNTPRQGRRRARGRVRAQDLGR